MIRFEPGAWPATPEGEYARRYLEPLMRDGSAVHVANVRTRIGVARVDDLVLPVTVNDAEWENSYVCSPYNHYVTYAREELRNLRRPLAERALGVVLDVLGRFLRWGELNRVAHVGNWLVSTNLYPPLGPGQVRRLTREVLAAFPRHAVVWRSVNPGPLRAALSAQGYRPVASRQLYRLDPAHLNHAARRRWARDARLLAEGPYDVVEPGIEDLPRVKALYDLLYLEKYSRHNPQFTVRFLAAGNFELRALRHRATGRLDGVAGYFVRDGVLTTPILGYDTALPQAVGLYRMLNVVVLQAALARGLRVNMSSGAANFKRSRGARPEVEVSMVLDRHLPPRRRLAWSVVALLANRVAVPLMRRLRL